MAKIGLQLYTVKEEVSKDLLGTLRAVAHMGYEGVEFASVPREPAAIVKEVLDESKLECAGVVAPLHELLDDHAFAYATNYCRTIGCDTILMPWLTDEYRIDADAYIAAASILNGVGTRCKAEGMSLLYHVHGYEFVDFDGVTGLDILMDRSNPELVGLEPDTYWIEHGGADSLAVYQRFSQRSLTIHFKDARDRQSWHDVEVGVGIIDVAGILAAAKSKPVRWFVVEQEKFEMPPMESAAISFRNLKRLAKENYKL